MVRIGPFKVALKEKSLLKIKVSLMVVIGKVIKKSNTQLITMDLKCFSIKAVLHIGWTSFYETLKILNLKV